MRLLDLFCGGGLAARGYRSAGFTEIVGVDIDRMPEYPYEFVRGDALEYLEAHGHEFDAIHASPPCLVHSSINRMKDRHVDLIPQTRGRLERLDRPWVIENVVGSGLRCDLMLCGTMFDLPLYRHRIFESSIPLDAPEHPKHVKGMWFPYDKRQATYGTAYSDDLMIPVYGNNAPAVYQFMAMGVPAGSVRRKTLIQGIPPVFTDFIGRQLLEHLSL